MFEFEKRELALGHTLIAGVDEAGRGPLAGPVACASVIMPLDDESIISGVNDSKKLSQKKREELFELITKKAISSSVQLIGHETIDEINILNATKQGMKLCVENLHVKPQVVLIDAININLPMKSKSIIHGDALSYSIACASILAKVTRDRVMVEQAALYPQYGFEKHKGYGTKAHIKAIKAHGPCKIHRRSFIKKFVAGDL